MKRLIVLLFIVMSIDLIFTLAGQPESYWTQGFKATSEVNPIGKIFLSKHPALFVLAFLIYLYSVIILIWKLWKSKKRSYEKGNKLKKWLYNVWNKCFWKNKKSLCLMIIISLMACHASGGSVGFQR